MTIYSKGIYFLLTQIIKKIANFQLNLFLELLNSKEKYI